MDLQALLELITRIGTDDAPSDEELTDTRRQLASALHSVLEGEAPDLEAGEEIRQAIDDIGAELKARAEARSQAAARAAELLEGVDDAEDSTDAQTEGEDDGEDEADDEAEGEEAPEPVANVTESGEQRSYETLRSALNRASVRADAHAEPEPRSDMQAIGMGPAAGAVTNPNLDLWDAGSLFHRYNRHVGRNGRQALIRLEKTYPEERQFGTSVEENSRMVNAVAGDRAIVAAGGICGPLAADFTHPICGDRGRPIRDALPSFQADRGGLRFAPAATLADLAEEAITVWTSENDASVSPAVEAKACPHIDCPDEVEAKVDAIVRCLTVGNFQAKFNPEFWRSRLDLLLVAHDRIAEQTLFAQMQVNATDVAWADGVGGTAKSALRALDRAAAGIRSRLRLLGATQLNFIAPAWLLDALRSSIVNNSRDDTDGYSTPDAVLAGFFSSRNIRLVSSPDIQELPDQNAGALVDFPATATGILYAEGSYIFLDGGTLDLGIEITDSTLNQTNDRQAFAETFEQATFRGCEALELTIPVGDDCECVAGS